jgi:hypothetical protein
MSQDSNIRHPVAEPCQDQQAKKPRDYDMDDSHDLQHWPKLAPVLKDCEITLGKAYCRADAASMRDQAGRWWLVLGATVPGMFAVLFAIVQLHPRDVLFLFSVDLTKLDPDASLFILLEFLAAVAAVVAVVIFGILVALPRKWLLERERAERCRFEKFGFLISPEAWSDPSDVRKARLSRHVEAINALNPQTLKGLAEGEHKPFEATSVGAAARIDEATLDQLIDYYREKRLRYQLQYFEHQAERRHRWDRLTWVLPIAFFFLSIAMALMHFIYDLSMHLSHNEVDKRISFALIVLAACLPVIGAAVRTFRMAHEFGRNKLRFRATSNELKQLLDRLQKEADPQAKLEILHKTERALQAEHREWLRLMIEAEWFG